MSVTRSSSIDKWESMPTWQVEQSVAILSMCGLARTV